MADFCDTNKYLRELIFKEGNVKYFQYRGYECEILRHRHIGHLCGYIIFDKKHACYKKDYHDIETMFSNNLPAHGGLTYSGLTENKKWAVGFDCAHLGDVSPFQDAFFYDPYATYKDIDFVERTIKNIVDYMLENPIEKSEQKRSKQNEN
ncbi:hypothetical protein ACRW9N_02420 [Listeria aquatica]|uniref:hypothetical protein n=1 Tax=Listeria aquatica TaxID=1494960 RepID=UPI003EF53C18